MYLLLSLFMVHLMEELIRCYTPQCFDSLLNWYSFPLKALTATAAIMGIIAMMHRSKQTATQIETTIKQNMHINYFSHLKDFKETIKSLQLKSIQSNNINELYKLLFPHNSPDNFTSQGTMASFQFLLISIAECSNVIASKIQEAGNENLIDYIEQSIDDVKIEEVELSNSDRHLC